MDRFGSHQGAASGDPFSSAKTTVKLNHGLRKLFVGLLVGCTSLLANGSLQADEPFERFMNRLKDERLFDLAIVYLEQQNAAGTLSEVEVAGIPLERALLLQQSSMFQRTADLRTARLGEAETAFKDFLDKQPQHPRRGEAKLGLGNLMLSQGEKNFTAGDKKPRDEAKLKTAADFFKRAQTLFDSTLTELTPILNELKGARVGEGEASKIEQRDRYRSENAQAQLLAVYARKRAADCLSADSEEFKKEQAESEAAFTKIYLNDTRADGLRNLALLYRGQIQKALGKLPEAMDSFQRIADITDVPDPMRGLKTKAVAELIRMQCDPGQAKYVEAIAAGQPWVDSMKPSEAQEVDWLELRIELANAQILQAKKLKETGGGATATKNLEDDARRLLQGTVRITGDHQDRARALLADIGVEAIAPVANNKPVKSFGEALTSAKTKLSDLESVGLTVEILRQQIAATQDAAEKQKLEAQIASTQSETSSGMKEVSDLLSKALALYGPEDNRSQLQEARYLLSYTLLRQDRLFESAATAGFTTQSSAGETWGLQAGMICLNAYQRMLPNAQPEQKEFIFTQLQTLAEYLLKTWPAAEESQRAANLLVQLTLISGDLDKAKGYVAMVPVTTPAGGKLRRQLGLSLWDDYNKRVRAAGDNAGDPALTASRQLALDTLREGVMDGAVSEPADLVSVESALALINLWLIDGKSEDAAALLNNSDKGPIPLLEANPSLATEGTTALRANQSALQIYIGQLAGQADASALDRVKATMEKLRSIAGEDEEGQKKLAAVFFRLARDLQQQLEAAPDAAARDRLASGIAVVLTQLRDSTKDSATTLWVGQTLAGIAKAVKGNSPSVSSSVQKLADDSIKTLDALRADAATTPETATKVRFVMAQAYQTKGQFDEALKLVEEILKQNPMMLDVQVEAARMLQASGTGKSAEMLTKAVNGYLPNTKTRQNTIWGWGRISQLTSGKPNLVDTFFESRLELARCRYLQAMLDKTPESKTKLLQRALSDITQTIKLYPELGGAAFTGQFDKLTRDLQRELKQNVVGLKGLSSK
jgi:hypothetical protein